MTDKAHKERRKKVPWQWLAYWGISYPMRNLKEEKQNIVKERERGREGKETEDGWKSEGMKD